MREYWSVIRRPRAIDPSHVGDYYWHNSPATMTVVEDDTPRDTGLLDAHGNPIMSVATMAPIGFTRS